MRKRRYLIVGLLLCLVGLALWHNHQTKAQLPTFLRGFGTNAEILGVGVDTDSNLTGPLRLATTRYYLVKASPEEVIAHVAKKFGQIGADAFAVYAHSADSQVVVQKTNSGDSLVIVLSSAQLSAVDSFLGSKWPGWLRARAGASPPFRLPATGPYDIAFVKRVKRDY